MALERQYPGLYTDERRVITVFKSTITKTWFYHLGRTLEHYSDESYRTKDLAYEAACEELRERSNKKAAQARKVYVIRYRYSDQYVRESDVVTDRVFASENLAEEYLRVNELSYCRVEQMSFVENEEQL